MNDAEVLKTIAVVACPILLGIIGWFLRGMVKSNQDATDSLKATVHQFDITLAVMKRDSEVFARDLNLVVGELKNLKSMSEDVVILKRDLQTAFRRIDEMKAAK